VLRVSLGLVCSLQTGDDLAQREPLLDLLDDTSEGTEVLENVRSLLGAVVISFALVIALAVPAFTLYLLIPPDSQYSLGHSMRRPIVAVDKLASHAALATDSNG
jgi:hypothetical protein